MKEDIGKIKNKILKPSVPKELVEEAKKYKSAEEFIDDIDYRQDEFIKPKVDWNKETQKDFKYKINCVDCKED